MNMLRFFLSVLLAITVVGCDPEKYGGPTLPPDPPPVPPKPCNATWSKPGQTVAGDTVVIARCQGADQYTQTPAGKNWVYEWYRVSMDVLTIERGTFIQKEISFVYPDFWPTPKSGIMIDKDVFPFAKGYIFAVTLKTNAQTVTVVSVERRSYLSPYGPLKYASPNSEYGSIDKSIQAFEASHAISAQKIVTCAIEDAGDFWVVHRRDGWGTDANAWLYRVDKKMLPALSVQPLPNASVAAGCVNLNKSSSALPEQSPLQNKPAAAETDTSIATSLAEAFMKTEPDPERFSRRATSVRQDAPGVYHVKFERVDNGSKNHAIVKVFINEKRCERIPVK
jgi:hypothetical protein